jgi:hypothetical protein
MNAPVVHSSVHQASAVGAGAEEITLRLLYQLVVILIATRLVIGVVRRLGQTEVSGEILAGLLLGPACWARCFPASCTSSSTPPPARSSRGWPRWV